MNEKEIDAFEKAQSQLENLHNEISILSKKKQDDALSKFKIKFINQVLSITDTILTEKHKPFSDFNKFNEDDMPTNSDATLILSQYLSCLETFRVKNISPKELNSRGKIYKIQYFWKGTERETYAPLKIK